MTEDHGVEGSIPSLPIPFKKVFKYRKIILFMKRGFAVTGFLLYLIVALYQINFALGLINMPNFIVSIEKWIILLGAILIIMGGIKYLRRDYY